MIRRKSGVHRYSCSAGGGDLVTQYEAGSAQAGERLALLARSQPEALDRIAASAANGSYHSLELLLGLIVELRLARPAIGRLSDDGAMIEDIEQDVLVEVARSIHRFRGDSKFTTWLYAVARNIGIAHLRRSKPTTRLGEDDVLLAAADQRMSSQVAQREVVRQAIASLPAAFRQTVFLRDIEGLSYAEIADRQGLEVNTVRSRLSRGRAMLAVRLS